MITHDCSTLGGNSGSVLLDLQTGEAVGLHFAGLYLQDNFAVPAVMSATGSAGSAGSSPHGDARRPRRPAPTRRRSTPGRP